MEQAGILITANNNNNNNINSHIAIIHFKHRVGFHMYLLATMLPQFLNSDGWFDDLHSFLGQRVGSAYHNKKTSPEIISTAAFHANLRAN